MPTISTTVDVDIEVDLSDFDDEDLLEEVERRELHFLGERDEMLDKLFYFYTQNQQDQFKATLSDIFYERLGRII